jgi:hypothetical protein
MLLAVFQSTQFNSCILLYKVINIVTIATQRFVSGVSLVCQADIRVC